MVDKCYGQNSGKSEAQCSKGKWGAIIQSLFTRIKVPPQIIVTKIRPICAFSLLFTLMPQKYG